jgi:hypothetical protein
MNNLFFVFPDQHMDMVQDQNRKMNILKTLSLQIGDTKSQ